MAATIVYDGASDNTGLGNQSIVELSSGVLIVMRIDLSGNDLDFYYSDDGGASWSPVTGSITNLYATYPVASICVDANDAIWCAYSDTSSNLHLKRGTFSGSTITWDSGDLVTGSEADTGVAVKAVQIGTSDYICVVAGGVSTHYYAIVKRSSGGFYTTHVAKTTLITGTGAHPWVALDFHHIGDGVTVSGSAPHFYMALGEADSGFLFYYKLTHSATDTFTIGTQRLITPSDFNVIDAPTPNAPIGFGYDGTRIVMAHRYGSSPRVKVWERDEADTTTTERTGMQEFIFSTLSAFALMFHPSLDDIYLIGVTVSDDPAYDMYDRSDDSWDGSMTVIEAADAAPDKLRAVVHSGKGAHVIWFDDSTYNIMYELAVAFNANPTAPTWNNVDNDVEDINSSLTLNWNFEDPDAGDTQSALTVRRKIGSSGSWNYWNGSSWQASEDGTTKITGTGEALLLAASWGAASDDTHFYGVKLWDAADTISPWSADVRVIPSEAEDPTITVPTPTGTPTVGAVETVTWTVAAGNTKYRVVVSDQSSPTDMEAGSLEFDTGIVVDNATTIANVSFPTNGVTRYVRVISYNADGLASAIDEVDVNVSYVAPSVPTLVITIDDTLDKIITTITNPGLLATETHNDVYRRKVGDTDNGIRVATLVDVNGVSDDYTPASGVAYEYLARAFGDNSTTEDSAWTA